MSDAQASLSQIATSPDAKYQASMNIFESYRTSMHREAYRILCKGEGKEIGPEKFAFA